MSNLDPAFTIGSQLTEPMRVSLGIGKAEAKQRALDLLARVGHPEPRAHLRAPTRTRSPAAWRSAC